MPYIKQVEVSGWDHNYNKPKQYTAIMVKLFPQVWGLKLLGPTTPVTICAIWKIVANLETIAFLLGFGLFSGGNCYSSFKEGTGKLGMFNGNNIFWYKMIIHVYLIYLSIHPSARWPQSYSFHEYILGGPGILPIVSNGKFRILNGVIFVGVDQTSFTSRRSFLIV